MNETNSNNNHNIQQQPHRARLVQIPNKLEETLLYNRSFDNNNNNNNSNIFDYYYKTIMIIRKKKRNIKGTP